jgi:trimeric autotransporter adhesin
VFPGCTVASLKEIIMKTPKTKLFTASLITMTLSLAPLTTARAQANDKADKPATNQPTPVNAESSTATTNADQTKAAGTTNAGEASANPQPVDQSQAKAQTAASPSSSLSTSDKSMTAMASDKSHGALRVAADDVKDRTDKKLAGHKVRGSDNKDLGNVKDFLVDPQSGEVVYAVISTGGIAGIGDKLHLVPFRALKPGTKKDEFTLSVDKATWDQMTPLKDEDFKAAKIGVSDEQRRQLAQRFESSSHTDAAAATYTADISAQLVRASDFRGKDVRSANAHVGSIEGLVIDQEMATATALLDPKKEFTNSKQKFLVPLNQLTIASAKHEPITTTLTRTDFENVQSGGQTASTTTTSTNANPAVATNDQTKSSAAQTNVAASGATMSDSQKANTQNGSTVAATNSSTPSATDTQLSPTGSSSAEQNQHSAATTKDQAANASSSSASVAKNDHSAKPTAGVNSTEESQDVASANGSSKTSSKDHTDKSSLGSTSTDTDSQSRSMVAKDEAKGENAAAKTDRDADHEKSSSTSSPSAVAKNDDTAKSTTNHDTKSSTDVASTTSGAKSNTDEASTTSGAKSGTEVASTTTAPKSSTDMASTTGSAPSAASTTTQSVASNDTTKSADQSATSEKSSDKSSSPSTSATVAQNDHSSTSTSQPSDIEQNLSKSNQTASNSAANSEPLLSPTGQTSADQTPAADASLISAAQSIRKALDNDSSLARADVQVTPENGKILLRGKVSEESIKRSIEKKAKSAANGKDVDNEITVEQK